MKDELIELLRAYKKSLKPVKLNGEKATPTIKLEGFLEWLEASK